MSTPTPRRITGDGLDLAVRTWGDPDAPTVVLVHGYPDTSAVWWPVAERLSTRFHVVAHDVRGAGESDAPDGRAGYALDHLVADLAAVIDATSPDRPVHLVGHDWGSIQGWEAVTTDRVGGRVASYTSISGPPLDHVGRWTRRNRFTGAGVRQALKSWYVFAFQTPRLPEAAWRRRIGDRLPAVLERLEGVRSDADWPAETLAADGAHGVNLYRVNVLARLARPDERHTEVPVQLIVPTRDRFVSSALVSTLDEVASDLRRREVPGGHWVVRKNPDAVARWIGEHVDRVETGTEPEVRAELVVVTGGGSGIGRATAVAFAERGARILIADIDEAGAARTAELCAVVGGEAAAFTVDVGDTEAMETFVKTVVADHGVPDVVVNNAGIGMAGGLLDTTVADWERILHVNLWGVIHGCRLFGRHMVDRGEGGHIVNVASAAAWLPSRAMAAYGTTKAAVLQLSESLRNELADDGIGVSAICPGIIDTPITRRTTFVGLTDAEQAEARDRAASFYRRRNLGPDAVADAILAAVEDDTPVVPVGVEATALYRISRFVPRLQRLIGKADL